MKILSFDEFHKLEGDLNFQALGNRWLESRMSAVLKIPSIIVPAENNYLLNPSHPEFPLIVPEITVPFLFDERLFTSPTG